jgi:hypothetical protein
MGGISWWRMTRTTINLEEKIGRTVGTRRPPSDPLAIRPGEQEDARAWKRAFGTPRIPKGLYRFASHEEADTWLMKMITRPARRKNAASPR